MTVMRLGLMRDLRKICQDFSRAMPRSTGARAWVSARLTVHWASSPPGGRLTPVVTQAPAALVGAVGQDRDALPFADPDDLVRAGGGQVVGAAGQGG